MEIIYSDSGIVKVKLIAPIIKQYTKVERPYLEFPEGVHICFYNDNLEYTSELQADYAIYYWDEKTKKVYSNSFARIENKDGTFYGQQGFEANQQLTNWKLKGSRGTLHVKDEPPNP